MDWKPISTAPYTGELELAVIEKDSAHAVAFPCRRVVGGWIAAETNKWIEVAGLVPPGALQVDGRTGSARPADGAQAGAIEAVRHRDELARQGQTFGAAWGEKVERKPD